ncbi:MAG: hypothetical protein MUF24_03555 [Chitinophagaceae bacterium]|jgi:hypothetical protein|nr:hypothetical protein [Chitinophagaceae bacterium]
MKTIVFSLLFLLFIYIGYRVFATIYYFRVLKGGLVQQNLEEFKQTLGVGYQFRYTADGIRRYKWRKGWYIIRASFDEAGRLINSHKNEVNLLRIVAEFTIPAPKNTNTSRATEKIA